MSDLAIRMSAVTKRFNDVVAVDDLDLEIREGEFFSLLGPSGCGKTTTLRMMAGFVIPDTGTVWLGEEDVTDVPPNKRAVNMVFQHYELFPHMTVAENVGYGLRLRKVPKSERNERVRDMLDVVGVGDLAERGAAQLSGGQMQRVALARALVNRPNVLLLDEPLSALDVKLRKKMQLELKSIQNELGTTFVYVTHDQEEALFLSDRIGIMSDGVLLQVGTPRDVYERPAATFVADFVGDLTGFTFRVDDLVGTQAIMRPRPGEEVRMDVSPDVVRESEVRAAIRPEHITLAPWTDGIAPQSIRLRGVVWDVVYLGEVTHHHVDTSVGRIKAAAMSSPGLVGLASGDEVAVTWSPEAAFTLQDRDPR